VRIGLHTSEATPVGNDYVDLAVHQVARISARAHGGQILLSAATATAVEGRLPADAALVPLGSFQLRGFPEPQPLFQLGHPDLRRDFPPLRLIGVAVHNLPFLRAGFVGRTEERRALASLLSEEGVVSIVGLGGVGKTRLAIQVAFDLLDRFPDGAWLVELGAISDPASIPRAVPRPPVSPWVSNKDGTETRIDPESGRTEAVITIGEASDSQANGSVQAAGYMWATSPSTKSIVWIDPATNDVEGRIPLPYAPLRIVAAFGSIWVTVAT
jgi:hypothetical protein